MTTSGLQDRPLVRKGHTYVNAYCCHSYTNCPILQLTRGHPIYYLFIALQEAAEYFLKASKGKNYGADMCYLKCRAKLRDGFQFVPYLEEMLKTYATFEGRDLDILLQIAACCYFCDNDLPSAAKYYLQAFEKYPNSELYLVCEKIFPAKIR